MESRHLKDEYRRNVSMFNCSVILHTSPCSEILNLLCKKSNSMGKPYIYEYSKCHDGIKLRSGSKLLMFSRRKYCTNKNASEEAKELELARIAKEASIDNPPTMCCQSGCANCVFIVWAESLTKQMENAGPEIAEKVLKQVEDPSMKAYLELELRIRGLKK